MAQQIDRVGHFQGLILEYGLREYEGKSTLAIAIRVQLNAMWNPETETWDDWAQFDMEATGFVYIVKTNGDTNNAAVQSLVKHAGWDGTLKAIFDATWQPKECQFSIEENEYQGKTSYRIGFINDRDRIPGATLANVDAEKGKQLEALHGAKLRAVAGSVKMNGTPTPPAKSMPTPARKPIPKEIPADSSIPF